MDSLLGRVRQARRDRVLVAEKSTFAPVVSVTGTVTFDAERCSGPSALASPDAFGNLQARRPIGRGQRGSRRHRKVPSSARPGSALGCAGTRRGSQCQRETREGARRRTHLGEARSGVGPPRTRPLRADLAAAEQKVRALEEPPRGYRDPALAEPHCRQGDRLQRLAWPIRGSDAHGVPRGRFEPRFGFSSRSSSDSWR